MINGVKRCVLESARKDFLKVLHRSGDCNTFDFALQPHKIPGNVLKNRATVSDASEIRDALGMQKQHRFIRNECSSSAGTFLQPDSHVVWCYQGYQFSSVRVGKCCLDVFQEICTSHNLIFLNILRK